MEKLVNMLVYFLMPFNMRAKLDVSKYPSRYLKRLKSKLEEYNTKEALIHFRRKAIERQQNSNYNGEYDRIRGILMHSTLPAETKQRLNEREAELKKLGATGLSIN